eukprot:2586381-Prymnesium_polylepis.1
MTTPRRCAAHAAARAAAAQTATTRRRAPRSPSGASSEAFGPPEKRAACVSLSAVVEVLSLHVLSQFGHVVVWVPETT